MANAYMVVCFLFVFRFNAYMVWGVLYFLPYCVGKADKLRILWAEDGMDEKAQTKTGFLKGAAWIALGGLVAKALGAAYKIPLTNLLGGEGLGVYQLIYSVYCLFLTVAATGIPSSVAKLTAEELGKGNSPKPLLCCALKLFAAVGGVASVLMAATSAWTAKWQGAACATCVHGYIVLSPAVFLVAVLSVFRGYFQGQNDMLPTALSEMTEQAVKVGLGLALAFLFRGELQKTVFCLLCAVTLSEGVALLFLWGLYRRKNRGTNVANLQNGHTRYAMRRILKLSVPVTFSGILLPISALLDSVLVPRLLSVYAENAVCLYGLFAGGAMTIINLPVSVCYGITAASIPAVAAAKGTEKGGRVAFSLFVTVAAALPCAVGIYAFGGDMAERIFRGLAAEERGILAALTKVSAASVLFLACAQTLSACLTAQGKPQYAALSWLVAMAAKTCAYLWWLKKPSVSIFGLAYATNMAYLVAFLCVLVYNLCIRKNVKKQRGKRS